MKANFYNMELDIEPGMDMEQKFDPLKTPYEINEGEFPRSRSLQEQFMFLLRYAVLAPSNHNTQPWRFRPTDRGIEVFADYNRRVRIIDPDSREMFMSIGAALFNIRVAAAHFGFSCRIDYNHSGDSELPLALVNLGRGQAEWPNRSYDTFFGAIVKRHTNRNPFLLARVPDSVLRGIRKLAEGGFASLMTSTDGALNLQVADLVATAERQQQQSSMLRKEVAEWVRPNRTKKADGVTGAALGVKNIPSGLAPWATRVLDLGKVRAARDKNLCAEAPALIVLYGEDAIPIWLEVGELLQRLLLTITSVGVQYSFFNMAIEVPEFRTKLRGLLKLPSWPQLLLRVGYCLTEPSPTPRRSVDEVIIRNS